MTAAFALGTVQFGLAYGVANAGGTAIDEAEIAQILDSARRSGVDLLDTAIAYGNAESALGRHDLTGFEIVTKLPGLPANVSDVAGWVNAQVEGSLARLGVSSLRGILLHRPAELDGAHGPALAAAIMALRDAGLTRDIGISGYGPEDLDRARQRLDISMAQLPFNVFDTALADHAEAYAADGIEVHIRSAFLQGLLLMPASRRPAYFDRWQDRFDSWDTSLAESGRTAAANCLDFVRNHPGIARVVVGVQSVTEFNELLAYPVGPLPELPDWGPPDPDLTDPSRWRTHEDDRNPAS